MNKLKSILLLLLAAPLVLVLVPVFRLLVGIAEAITTLALSTVYAVKYGIFYLPK